jgi:hypothetical protein
MRLINTFPLKCIYYFYPKCFKLQRNCLEEYVFLSLEF